MDTDGFCVPIRARRDISMDRAKNPASYCAVPPFRTHPMAESAEGSYAVIVSESAPRPLAGTDVHEKRRRGLTNPRPEGAALSWIRYRQPPGPPRPCARR